MSDDRTIGPNTDAPPGVLQADCILVCGEDRENLLPLLPSYCSSHRYRGYEFWRLNKHTLILGGMGCGCVEPLIWELTRPGIVRRIILIGTAGKIPGAAAEIGRPYAITEAYLAGTALDGEDVPQPLRPRWDLPAQFAATSSASTDFFYGFSPRVLSGGYPFAAGRLRQRYAELSRTVQLVDMEVAPFYCFCERFGGNLRYLAIKGASNELCSDAQQIAESPAVIERCYRLAVGLLGGRSGR